MHPGEAPGLGVDIDEARRRPRRTGARISRSRGWRTEPSTTGRPTLPFGRNGGGPVTKECLTRLRDGSIRGPSFFMFGLRT